MNVSRGRRDHRGSVSAELALVTPLLLLLLVFVVMLGRLAEGRLQVDDAAAQAARAATTAGDAGSASLVARQSATAGLATDGVTCSTLTVATDTSDFVPGGVVRVAVTCTVSMAGLSLLHLPGSETLRGSAVSPVDEYRSVGP
jgi:Flp pilus assembly protein TadG